MTRISKKELKKIKNQRYHKKHYSKMLKPIKTKNEINSKYYSQNKDSNKKRYRLKNPKKTKKTDKEINSKYYKNINFIKKNR